MRSDLGLVLLSGGMDSLVCAAVANQSHDKLAFLHLSYGQKTSKKEKSCFDKIADFYKVDSSLRKTVDMSFLSQIGGSSLTDDKLEVTDYKGDSEEIPSSYVPFRNAHIISMAVSWAEVIGAKKIYIGANYEDSPGYPDCRPEYYEAFNKLIKAGTAAGDIELVTPVLMDKKKDIVKKAIDLKAPLELTWSCYKNEDEACGVCDSCALRLRGFKEANTKDPIPYSN
ncbi:MAG: 7-cyano-7-deazaguanine synthase QueC [Bacteriovoracaceae bacterium]|nr:7-cyano-7-deazaguanine synthase QueC [Bacteriovoracaceae bacterium]